MTTESVLVAIISYVLGLFSGIAASYYLRENIKAVDYKNVVLIVVSIMWTLSVAVEIVNPNYNTSPLIHGLMGSIVGFFYRFEPKK